MKIKRTLLAAFSLILLAITCAAQGEPLKVFISADMEGVDGVSTWDVQANAKGRDVHILYKYRAGVRHSFC